jgi:hypothetical protein
MLGEEGEKGGDEEENGERRRGVTWRPLTLRLSFAALCSTVVTSSRNVPEQANTTDTRPYSWLPF